MSAKTDTRSFGRKLGQALDPASTRPSAVAFRSFQRLVVLAGLAAVMVGSVPAYAGAYDVQLTIIVITAATLLGVEYAVRLVLTPSAPSPVDGGGRTFGQAAGSRWRWIMSPAALIDLLAAVPAPLALMAGADLDTVRILGIFSVLKLMQGAPALALIARVVRNEGQALVGLVVGLGIVLLLASTAAYVLERASQPATFGTIPRAMWWAITTLTTTGYGDSVPTTFAGRLLGGVTMMAGLCGLALFAGILTNGFAQEIRRRGFLETWGLVARMPMFTSLGASVIAEVPRLLHAHDVPADRTVVHVGEPGDCMYFIARGEVDVRLETGSRRLGPGDFFGELALITGAPRSATVVTTTTTTLLQLDVADFLGLAATRPELVQAIKAEARRRQGSPDPAGTSARTPGAPLGE